MIVLPPGYATDPNRTTVMSLPGGQMIVAGPRPATPDREARFAATAFSGTGEATPIWTTALANAPQGAQMAANGDGGVLLLLPRRMMVSLTPPGTDRGRGRIVSRGPARPDLLVDGADGPLSIVRKSGGQTEIVALGPDGKPAGPARSGPALSRGQTLSAAAAQADGRLVVAADDPVRGFHLWREADGDWGVLTDDGASRFAQNAGVWQIIAHGPGVAVAVGPRREVRHNLLGFTFLSELLVWDEGTEPRLLIGELRVSPTGLLVPRAGAAAVRELSAVAIGPVASGPDGLSMQAVGRDGQHRWARLAPDGGFCDCRAIDAPLVGFAPDGVPVQASVADAAL